MDIRDQAYRYLEARPRTAAEMKKKLAEKEFAEEDIDTLVAELEENGYIDDADYAMMYMGYAFEKGRSLARANVELRCRGVDADDIQKGIFLYEDEHDVDIKEKEREVARGVAEKFVQQNGSDEKAMQKLARKLDGLGYDAGLITTILSENRR